ncbi:uncharacterized protein LOC131676800 isoform X2 [Topomyia yanbarensis]|uniref:uncharacterized protein LOC131676800 isoform X2 n=1 Tax=Topomyia yanbarensis TaxID=2498891 RepID=UPI00273BD67F|nr:uncharacterized protein LOC131676800 isoform X2 [Topomyia yanbarensis]
MKCVIPNCGADFHKQSEWFSKHYFPLDATRRELWIKAIVDAHCGRSKQDLSTVNFEKARICSDHFASNCFTMSENRRRLKLDAIPTIFPFGSEDPVVNQNRDREKLAMKIKRYKHCVVRGCEQSIANFTGITTHLFPLEMQECKQWVNFSKNSYASRHFVMHGPAGMRKWRMCSRHFEPSLYKNIPNQARTLKPGSLPTLHPADSSATESDYEGGVSERPRLTSGLDADGAKLNSVPIPPPSLKGKIRPTVRYRPPLGYRPTCTCSCCLTRRPTSFDQGHQTDDTEPLPEPARIPLKSIDSCRLCFTTQHLQPLYSGLIVVRDELLNRIYACTGILIVPKPKESTSICVQCAEMINTFYAFRQQTRSNNQALMLKNERKLGDENFPNDSPSFKVYKQKRKRKITNPPPAPPVKVKREAPKPLRVEFISKKKLPISVPSNEPNPLELHIKEEPDDPLEMVELSLQTEQRDFSETIQLDMSVDHGEDPHESESRVDQTESDSWKCWHCQEVYRFQFECAKHVLQEHREEVDVIRKHLQLDELNCNMLEMMSVRLRKE